MLRDKYSKMQCVLTAIRNLAWNVLLLIQLDAINARWDSHSINKVGAKNARRLTTKDARDAVS